MNLLVIALAAIASHFKSAQTDIVAVTPKLQTAGDALATATAVVNTLAPGNSKDEALKILNAAAEVVATAIVVGHTVEASVAAS